jgi:subtilisin family serine protease
MDKPVSFDALGNATNINLPEGEVKDCFPNNDTGEIGKWVKVNGYISDIAKLKFNPSVAEVEKDITISLDPITEEYDPKTWNLEITKAYEAHAKIVVKKRPIVAVVDTGTDQKHAFLKDSLVPGRNIVDDNNDPSPKYPDETHATHVSGTIVMKTNNGNVVGAAKPAALVMPVRVLDGNSGSCSNIAKGIVWATDHGANIINLSLGGRYSSKVMRDAVNYALKKNVFVVAARGNSGDSKTHYPSGYKGVIAATATGIKDGKEVRAWFSSSGGDNCVAAPGAAIFSTIPGDKFATYSGTSMATPHVAAAAALMIAQYPALTVAQIRDLLLKNGDAVESDVHIGQRVNYLKLVEKTAPKTDDVSVYDFTEFFEIAWQMTQDWIALIPATSPTSDWPCCTAHICDFHPRNGLVYFSRSTPTNMN